MPNLKALLVSLLFLFTAVASSHAAVVGNPGQGAASAVTTAAPAASSPVQAAAQKPVLKVAVSHFEALTMRNAYGPPTGIEAALMTRIAERLGMEVQWVWYDTTPAVREAVVRGEVDLGIGGQTITAVRERTMCDFSHPTLISSFSMLVPGRERGGIIAALQDLAKSAGPVWIIVWLFPFGVTVLVFICDRFGPKSPDWDDEVHAQETSPEGSRFRNRLGRALMCAVSMVGYGDDRPRRLITLFVCLLVILPLWQVVSAIFIGETLAVSLERRVETNIRTVEDLKGRRVAVKVDSSSSEFAGYFGAAEIKEVPDIEHGLALIRSGKVDALIHDDLRLRGLLLREHATDVVLIPLPIEMPYGVVFPPGSPLRKRVNVELLELSGPRYLSQLVRQYYPENPVR